MSAEQVSAVTDLHGEIPALIETLLETERRLEQLTAGQVDSVAGPDGQMILLRSAQEQLRRGEAVKQTAILNALPAHIALLDTQGFIISVNEAWRRFPERATSQAPGYSIGVNYLEICDGARGKGSDEAHRVAAGIRSVLSCQESSFSMEYSCHSAREQRWLLLTVTPLADDRPNGAVVMHVDITARREAAEALRGSLDEFRTLSEAMPQIVWITQPDGQNIYFNQNWVSYTGLSLEESLGHGWNKPFHPEDRARSWHAWNYAVETVGIYSLECRLRRVDGAYRWWLIRGVPMRDRAGSVLKWFGTCTDIHDLKEAELQITRTNQELRESEEKFRQLAANVTDVFYVTSADLRQIHYVSPAYQQVWGRSPEALYTHPDEWHASILPEERERVFAAFQRVVLGELNVNIEFRITRPDGTTRWILSRAFQVRNAEGKVIRLTGIASDITEQKRVEAELAKTHRELLETSRLAGMADVATAILHNVGNVLNSVNVASTCLAEGVRRSKAENLSRVVALLRAHEGDVAAFLAEDPRGRQIPGYLAQLAGHLAGERAEALDELAQLQKNIEHIKDIVTMQQGLAKTSGVTETTNVTELVEDALRMNLTGLTQHNIQVHKEFVNVPLITVQRHKLLQILVNLVRNAEHACASSGITDKKIIIRITQALGRVRICISDNGTGILPENLTSIFSHGFTTKKDGHGFGLHGAALAAKQMGGSLSVQSDGPGHGAAFTLELPQQSEHSSIA